MVPYQDGSFTQGKEAASRFRLYAILLVLILVAVPLSGCIGGGGDDDGSKTKIKVPFWEQGRYWIYTFNTPEFEGITSKIVVAGSDDTNYQVGTASLVDARRHSVLNFNPMLGRIDLKDLAVYEKGEPQSLLKFPMKKGSTWSFELFDLGSWNAQVKTVRSISTVNGTSKVYEIEAESSAGGRLYYSYSKAARWLYSLRLFNELDEEILEMDLISYGTDHTGDVYFVRGVDLYDEHFKSNTGSPVVELYDSFVDQGHPDWGPFDLLIYYLQVETGSGASGSLSLRDHTGNSPLARAFGPNYAEESLGDVQSESGEWQVTVTLEGSVDLRFRIAGGIEYTWSVS